MAEKSDELQKLANVLSQSIVDIFKEKGEIKFSKEPVLARKNILEYGGKMRADGMEKFNNSTYVSAVNYYATAKTISNGCRCR